MIKDAFEEKGGGGNSLLRGGREEGRGEENDGCERCFPTIPKALFKSDFKTCSRKKIRERIVLFRPSQGIYSMPYCLFKTLF